MNGVGRETGAEDLVTRPIAPGRTGQRREERREYK